MTCYKWEELYQKNSTNPREAWDAPNFSTLFLPDLDLGYRYYEWPEHGWFSAKLWRRQILWRSGVSSWGCCPLFLRKTWLKAGITSNICKIWERWKTEWNICSQVLLCTTGYQRGEVTSPRTWHPLLGKGLVHFLLNVELHMIQCSCIMLGGSMALLLFLLGNYI